MISVSRAADPVSRVELLPVLVDVNQWEVPAESAGWFHLEQRPQSLGLEIGSFEQGKSGRLNLKAPVAFPEWADGMAFSVSNRGGGFDMGITFRVVVLDAKNQEFLFKTVSPKLPHQIQYFPNHFRSRPIRFSVPGLQRLVLVPVAGGNVEAVGERRMPVPPYRVAGLQIESVNFSPPAGQENRAIPLYLLDFAFTHLSRQGSALYYALDGVESFGELDAIPAIPLGQLGPHFGASFSVSWEVRDQYDGQPFLVGGQNYQLDESDPDYALSLNEKVAFPVKEKGTYWIHVTRRWSQSAGNKMPQKIDDFELRLDVFQGKEKTAHVPIPASEAIPESLIRIAPKRPSSTYQADEPFRVQTFFWKPAGANTSWRLEVRNINDDKVLKTQQGTFASDAESPLSVAWDISALAPGSYRLRAEVLADGKAVDRTERLVGRVGGEKVSATIPASIPSWQEMLASDRSLVVLQPHLDEPNPARRLELIKRFIDNASTITSRMEFELGWRDLEPLPGVYDWSELDQVLAYAHEKGMTALIWPSIVGSEPEWLPSAFEVPRNADGSIFGAPAYLFHGGRLNLWHAEAIRKPALRFLTALATHLKSNPAVHGYYVVTEHPADSPVHNWLVGGSVETQADFRKYCRETFSSLKNLNERWGTQLKSWDEIGVPPGDASPLQRLDWLVFIRDGIGLFLVDAVKAIRKADSHRIIQVYGDGADSETLKKLKPLGCMMADGGSQYPETFGGDSMGIAAHGLQRRAEEVSVGHWSWMFPTQLDATLFTMMLGGGGNANIKMFIPLNKTFEELRRPTYSLDRFEKLLPIWNELRVTEPLPRDNFTLHDRNSQLLNAGSTQFFADPWTHMLCMEAGLLSPWVPLEMAVKGKMIFLQKLTAYEKPVIEGLVRYVEEGGVLVMNADAGRHVPEIPEADWVLLKRFGFTSPPEKESNGSYIEAVPLPGDIFPENAKPFRLRDIWSSSLQADEHMIATFQGDASRPAITWKTFGKGRVVVIWTSTIVPARADGGYPFLRDIARWAGVSLRSEGTPSIFWTNLLKNRSQEIYYGLVYHSAFPSDGKGPGIEGVTRWVLPEGEYQVRELINAREIGVRTARQLKEEGLPARLNPYEVAIYRMES